MRHTKISSLILAALTSTLLGVGCSSHETRSQADNNTTPSSDYIASSDYTQTSDQVLQTKGSALNQNSTSLVVSFDDGQSLLTNTDRSNMKALIEKANYDTINDKIEVAVWADYMTSADNPTLPKNQRQIAEQRIDQIKTFLKTRYDITKVKFYNMSEGSNWLARAFNTRDAELKSLFSKEQSAPMSDQDFQVIKSYGGVSRAVFVITHK